MSTQPEGFLSFPPIGKGPAILVLHAWWGLNDTLRNICNDLSEQGYLVFAPDLYHGKLADTIDSAEALSSGLFKNFSTARSDVAKAAKFLSLHPSNTGSKVAVIGFSLGAFFALDVSITLPEHIHSVVTFYGTGPADFSASRAKYCCHFADTDEFEPFENVDALHHALEKAKRPAKFYKYEGTSHWFAEPDRPQYDADASKLAWQRTMDFLKKK